MNSEIFFSVLSALVAYRMLRPAIDISTRALWASSKDVERFHRK